MTVQHFFSNRVTCSETTNVFSPCLSSIDFLQRCLKLHARGPLYELSKYDSSSSYCSVPTGACFLTTTVSLYFGLWVRTGAGSALSLIVLAACRGDLLGKYFSCGGWAVSLLLQEEWKWELLLAVLLPTLPPCSFLCSCLERLCL